MTQPKRNKLLERLEFLRTENESLKAELEAFGACDPVKLQQKKVAIALAKESAVRWTGELYVAFSGGNLPADAKARLAAFRKHRLSHEVRQGHGL